ncbi:PRC and DUF2382 domain-containing protein [Janibacter indicus]|uniref:PRC and DUF2382 domain-containing protein n=1 Tax=Janibacter indicus TaxID=857417 RepID=A0A7L9IZ57_9MICO|nr:PRC and DUF2382 domain-containing protein [Janibacter indicus]QOK22394.1 PRC and DUF2382 domain-containing protein [Janibacter indicus]
MISTADAQNLLSNAGQVVDSDGDKIGKIGQVFLDDRSGEPAWVTVKTGMFGGAESFVPLTQGTMHGNDVSVPYTKDKVKGAPRVEDSQGHLEPAEEDELYAYYGLAGFENAAQGREQGRGQDPKDEGRNTRRDSSGPDADASMTRSEEQLNVGTTTETAGKARLRKFIVTEHVTKTVPVSHEEVRIEREPITDADRGDAPVGRDLSEEEQEVELKAERVVVDKEAVPVERVKLGTETVTENETVDEQVRKEQIEATDGTDPDEHPRDARR